MSGYEAKIFVEKPSDNYECPLCFDVLNDPRQCLNGHCFCNGCISKSVIRRPECPICKDKLTADFLGRNLQVKNIILEMQTKCMSRFIKNTCDKESSDNDIECAWIGKLSERELHFNNDCDFRLVKCPNEFCSEIMQHRCVEEHMDLYDRQEDTCLTCGVVFRNIHESRLHVDECVAKSFDETLSTLNDELTDLNIKLKKKSTKHNKKKNTRLIPIPEPVAENIPLQNESPESIIVQSRAATHGTKIEYLNRKEKWVYGNITGPVVYAENQETMSVLNVHNTQLEVSINNIRLISGSVMVGINTRTMLVNYSEYVVFNGRNTLYDMKDINSGVSYRLMLSEMMFIFKTDPATK
jgi:hypothetical protein